MEHSASMRIKPGGRLAATAVEATQREEHAYAVGVFQNKASLGTAGLHDQLEL